MISLLYGNSMMRSLLLAHFLGHRRTILGDGNPILPKRHEDLHYSSLPVAFLHRTEITNHKISGCNGRPQAVG